MSSRSLTNLELLHAAVVVALLGSLTLLWDDQLVYWLAVIGSNIAVSLVIFHLQQSVHRNSILLRPVSPRTSLIITNTVVTIFLSLIGIPFILTLLARSSDLKLLMETAFLLIAGIGFGRYFQKRSSSHSWLPYAFSFLGAFLVIAAV